MPKSLVNEEPQIIRGNPAVHLSLQGKGGVGKSLIASFLAQFYKSHGVPATRIDTDPVKQTLSQYAALGAQHLRLNGREPTRPAPVRFPHGEYPRRDESSSSIRAR